MRRFIKFVQVKRHAAYIVVQDGEAGASPEEGVFYVLRWDASRGSRPRPVGNVSVYKLGDKASRHQAMTRSMKFADALAAKARGILDSGRTNEPRTLEEAESDARAAEALRQASGEEPISLEDALRLDREAEEKAQAMGEKDQEKAKADVIAKEMSPDGLRAPVPSRR